MRTDVTDSSKDLEFSSGRTEIECGTYWFGLALVDVLIAQSEDRTRRRYKQQYSTVAEKCIYKDTVLRMLQVNTHHHLSGLTPVEGTMPVT